MVAHWPEMKLAAHVTLVAAALALPAAAAAPRPRLTLVRRDPVTVAGAHFRPLGLVRVTIYVDPAVTRAATATRSGTFRLSFGHLDVGACGGAAQVLAVGAHGQQAAAAIPRGSCMTR
jgi:hypothetical protein